MGFALFAAWWLWSGAHFSGDKSTPPVALRAADLSAEHSESGDVTLELFDVGNEPEALALPDATAAFDAATPSGQLNVRVLRPDGRPARRARIVLVDDQDILISEGDVDPDGVWRHRGFDRAATVFVRGVTSAIESFALERARGAHDLRLPDGETLRGMVLIDGAPPDREFVIELLSEGFDRPPWNSPWQRLRAFTLPNEARLEVNSGIPTDPDGRFELSSVPTGAELEFRAPGAYWIDRARSTSQPVRVAADTVDVVLALHSPPRLHGRVVDLDGRPVAEASVDLSATPTLGWIDDNGDVSRGESRFPEPSRVTLDSDARFSIPIADHAAERRPRWRMVAQQFDLVVRSRDGRWVEASAKLTDLTRDHDLGDLVLQHDRVWLLRVLDERGAPIPGAHVTTIQQTARNLGGRVPSADESGSITVVQSKLGAGRVRVSADGFLSCGVELPPEPSTEAIEVRLESDTRLTVIAHGPWDAREVQAGWQLKFELTGEDPIALDPQYRDRVNWDEYFGYERAIADAQRSKSESAFPQRDAADRREGSVSEISARPRWSLELLRPDHALTLRVGLAGVPDGRGPCPEAWLSEQELWLEPGEERIIHVDLSGWTLAR
ncbi:MAG: hypothetical protein DHS20C15_28490 [Planctomycetota bacterium]|nr:MAG: hypothetical protein DHS20C15_28490 [Planctomycetota bacterium]